MELWKEKAVKVLIDSLYPVPVELNELDWKSGLSSKTDRLAQHICALANLQGGGLLVYDVNRLIDMPPRSRNEILAQTMLQLGICERRGSGIDRAIAAIEEKQLPPVKFEKSKVHTRVILFPPKKFKEMTKTEKVNACYQHACLLYEDRKELNNTSLRQRFGLDKNNSYTASKIISDTFIVGLIKYANPEITSKKYATYIPYYA